MTHKAITVSVPATPGYLSLAEKFLSECRQHAEQNPDLVELANSIQTAHANLNQLVEEPYYQLEDEDAVGEVPVQVHAPEPPAAPTPPPAPVAVVEYELTEKAGAFTLEQYLGQGWSEEALIEDGYLRPKAQALPTPPPPPTPASSTAAAPVATTAPSAPTHSGGQALGVDADGRHWDADIDSGAQKKNVDGRWARRKNLTDDFYNQRKAMLVSMAQGSVGVGSATVQPQPTTNSTPVPPPGTTVATAPAASGLSAGAQLIRDFNNAHKADPTNVNQVTFLAAVKAAGLSTIADISKPANAHLLPAIRQALFGG